MASVPRLTTQTLAVLGVLLGDPLGTRYGFDVAREARIATGTLYPILARLEKAGWLTSEWEDIDERLEGRRRRRLYRLTGHGVRAAEDALRDHVSSLRIQGLFPGMAG